MLCVTWPGDPTFPKAPTLPKAPAAAQGAKETEPGVRTAPSCLGECPRDVPAVLWAGARAGRSFQEWFAPRPSRLPMAAVPTPRAQGDSDSGVLDSSGVGRGELTPHRRALGMTRTPFHIFSPWDPPLLLSRNTAASTPLHMRLPSQKPRPKSLSFRALACRTPWNWAGHDLLRDSA